MGTEFASRDLGLQTLEVPEFLGAKCKLEHRFGWQFWRKTTGMQSTARVLTTGDNIMDAASGAADTYGVQKRSMPTPTAPDAS